MNNRLIGGAKGERYTGMLPAGGLAERFHRLPKYLLPIEDSYLIKRHIKMLESLVVYPMDPMVSKGWQVGSNGADWHMLAQLDIGAIDVGWTKTMSETLIRMRRSTYDYCVLMGMPDTYIDDFEAYSKLHQALDLYPEAIAIMGVFTARPGQYRQGGMIRNEDARVTEIVDKADTDQGLDFIWGLMAWRPEFWDYIKVDDPHPGYAAQRAIENGEIINMYLMRGGFWDCGTPERYFELIRHLTEER